MVRNVCVFAYVSKDFMVGIQSCNGLFWYYMQLTFRWGLAYDTSGIDVDSSLRQEVALVRQP